jgi:hypothetical protein
MRLSLWTQYSSNHSASFSTVGQFDNEELAEHAADKLRGTIREIAFWWEQFSDAAAQNAAEKQLQMTGVFLTPPEQRLRQEYEVAWCGDAMLGHPMAIDWIRTQTDVYSVYQFRDLVLVEPSGNTWCGAHPFDFILAKLGAQVASDVEDFSRLQLHVHFTAPTSEVGDKVMTAITVSHQHMVKLPDWGNAVPGEITRMEQRFTLRNVEVRWAGVRHDLLTNMQSLLTYLEQSGCTDIQYQFSQY